MRVSNWIRSILGKRQPIRRKQRPAVLALEQLESRLAPIVGAFGPAQVVTPGQGFDGVVRINNVPAGRATGTLLATQRHILTAAHVVDTRTTHFPATQVAFELARPNPTVPGATINVEIPITVPANIPGGNTFQLVPGGSGYTPPAPPPGGANPVWNPANPDVNDIAVLRLVDQVNPQPDRHLVAPKGATGFAPFAGNEARVEFRQVGYGLDGIGNEGNNADEVQVITITNIPPAGAPPATFRLSYNPGGGQPLQTTANIDTNDMSAQVIATRLVALPGIGRSALGNDNVNVAEVQTAVANSRTFHVRFVNGLRRRNILPLGRTIVVGGGGFAINIRELWNGSDTGGIKRLGDNRFDAVDPANATRLLYDFDNGQAAQDANAAPEFGGPDTGLGAREVFGAKGDSGGPLFVLPVAGAPFQIAGVLSGIGSPGAAPDIRYYVDSGGTRWEDNSFGEVGFATRVSRFIDNFINPATAGNYHIVLDMNQQLLGRDGISENLTITASLELGHLVLRVTGSGANDYNGVYFLAPIGNILSLTLRGSPGDREEAVIDPAVNFLIKVNQEQIAQLRDVERLEIAGGSVEVAEDFSIEELRIVAGLLHGTSTLTVTSWGEWTGGTMSDAGVTHVAAGAQFYITGPGVKTLASRTLENAGLLSWYAGAIDGGTGIIQNLESGLFSGLGILTGSLVNEGQLELGGAGATGTISINGDYTQSASGSLYAEFGSAGAGSDRLVVAGVVTLGGYLSASTRSGFTGGGFTVIDNTGPDPVSGTFDGLPEGAVFSLGGGLYQITYVGGDGNDVVLLPVSSTAGQWASYVIDFSSQFNPSPGSWSAAQALGAPDTFDYGDLPSSWSASYPDNEAGVEFLTLGFATPVYATGVTVRETYGNGFVTRIDLVDEFDQLHPIWTGTDPSQPGSPVDFTVSFPATAFLVKGVRVYVNANHNPGDWEEIDAVMLHGDTSGGFAAMSSGGPGGLTRTRVSSMHRANRGPSATLAVSGPVALGVPVTLLFRNPRDGFRSVPASSFRYSFDFNNDGDFTDPGEVRDGTSPSARHTFTRRGWHVIHGRVRAADGRFTDFWLRVFVA